MIAKYIAYIKFFFNLQLATCRLTWPCDERCKRPLCIIKNLELLFLVHGLFSDRPIPTCAGLTDDGLRGLPCFIKEP